LAEAQAIKSAAHGVAVTAPAKDEATFRAAMANPAVDNLWVYFIPTKALMDEARAAGKEVHVTPFVDADRTKAWRAVRAAGVTTFCTDFAAEVRRLWAPRR
jgi:glycerophosphoryl diester phosphodiesterase